MLPKGAAAHLADTPQTSRIRVDKPSVTDLIIYRIFIVLGINYSHYLNIIEMDFTVLMIADNLSPEMAIVKRVLLMIEIVDKRKIIIANDARAIPACIA